MMKRAAVYGATGFIGAELVRRLLLHPEIELVRVAAADYIGQPLSDALPNLTGRTELVVEEVPDKGSAVDPVDVLFLALPHQVSWRVVSSLGQQTTRVVDCSGAFRVNSAQEYERYYAAVHPLPELLPKFVYGLPELNRQRIASSRFVASPGCFATAIALGLLPLARAGLLQGDVQVVGITGSSGAGSSAVATTHHPVRAGTLRAYRPLSHPHAPEVVQTLRQAGARKLKLHFVPVAAPLVRGILVSSFAKLTPETTAAQVAAAFEDTYRSEPFVRVPSRRLPEVVNVAGSNFAEAKAAMGPRDEALDPGHDNAPTVNCVSAIDNLLKGGAGQAIQNMNLMLGLPEITGLLDPGSYP